MSTFHFQPAFDHASRRQRLYAGEIFVYAPTRGTRALIEHAQRMIEDAFASIDPLRVHEAMPVEHCVGILTRLKPAFIHHPRSQELVREVLVEFGCDPERTYFDVPRLRSAMPHDYLSAGIAYAFHPHRDTWYSAPPCQLNWWLPIYEMTAENGLAFHPRYWNKAVRNGSRRYNYYRWNAEGRIKAARYIRRDTRPQPRPEQPLDLEPQVRPVCPPGGLVLFSGAQLHSTVRNTTGRVRWSIDFRTVNLDDAAARRGAPNIDSASTGTTLRDFKRVTDLAQISDEVVALYDSGGIPEGGTAVFGATAGTG